LFSHNSVADGARELFKPSKDAENLVVAIFKNWKVSDFCLRWNDIHYII